jgi:restriction endonuclease S subunit
MAVTLEEVLKMAEQLSTQDRNILIEHLQEQARQRKLTKDEWLALFDSMKYNVPVAEGWSDKREDWYSDDGR